MLTPPQALSLDVSGLNDIAQRASTIADVIINTAGEMHRTIHDDLRWQGAAARSAEDKADREQTQMRAIAIAYDDLSAACAGAYKEMAYPVSEIKTVLTNYAVPPVSVGDDWSITGIQDPNSEAGIQLARLSGLITTLTAADAKWGAAIASANDELSRMAPAAVLAAEKTAVQQVETKDQRANPDRIRTSAAAFQQSFGRPPVSPSDWSTAEILNPKSYTDKYQGVDPEIRVVRIKPVPGQGVVRTSHYIEQRDVSNPFSGLTSPNPGSRDMGDNRTADANFDPEHARVSTYVDYENGIVVMRQNPSVEENDDGGPGKVKVSSPSGQVWQNPDGAVRVKYDAANPFAPPGSGSLGDHSITVNGDLVVSPGANGATINGTRTDYPSLEAYQDRPDGTTHTLAIDPAAAGNSTGPMINLPYHHDVGPQGGQALSQFTAPGGWNSQYDVPIPLPATQFGSVNSPPMVATPPPTGGMI
ncbi:MAG: hypothetical protein J2P17_12990 [Mycobacterium sp.]|nr:hypothetical protein [Mycobacterium sp.]